MAKKTWVGNFGRSILFGIGDALKGHLEPIEDLANDDNKEFLTNIKDTLVSVKKGQNRISKMLESTVGPETRDLMTRGIDEALKDGKHFLKTGETVRKKRTKGEEDLDDMGSFNIDDGGDFGFSEDDLDLSDLPPPEELLKNAKNTSETPSDLASAEIGAAQIEATNAGTKALVEVGVTTNQAIATMNASINDQTAAIGATTATMIGVETDLAKQAATLQQVLHKQQLEAAKSMNENLASIVSFNTNVVGKFTDAALNYFTDSLTELKKISAGIERAFPDRKAIQREDSLFDKLGMGNNRAISLSGYASYVKDNIVNKTTFGSFAQSFLDPGNLQAMFDEPIKNAVSGLTSYLISNTLEKSMDNFSRAFSDFIPAMLMKIGSWSNRSDNPVLQTIGEIFGISSAYKKKTLGQYEKGPVPFDGITHRTINVVIPRYLSEIVGLLGGQRRAYDYDSGLFKDVEDLKKDKENSELYAAKNALDDTGFVENMEDLMKTFAYQNEEQYKEMQNMMNLITKNVIDSGEFGNLKDNSYLDTILRGTDQRYAEFFKALMQRVDEEMTANQRLAFGTASQKYINEYNSRTHGDNILEATTRDNFYGNKKEEEILRKIQSDINKLRDENPDDKEAEEMEKKLDSLKAKKNFTGLNFDFREITNRLDSMIDILAEISGDTGYLQNLGSGSGGTPPDGNGPTPPSGGGYDRDDKIARMKATRDKNKSAEFSDYEMRKFRGEATLLSTGEHKPTGSRMFEGIDEAKAGTERLSMSTITQEKIKADEIMAHMREMKKDTDDAKEEAKEEEEEKKDDEKEEKQREKLFSRFFKWIKKPSDAISHLFDSATQTLSHLVFGTKDKPGVLKPIIDNIKDSFKKMWASLKDDFITPFLQYITGKEMLGGLKNIFSDLKEDFRGKLNDKGVYEGGYFSTLWNFATNKEEKKEDKEDNAKPAETKEEKERKEKTKAQQQQQAADIMDRLRSGPTPPPPPTQEEAATPSPANNTPQQPATPPPTQPSTPKQDPMDKAAVDKFMENMLKEHYASGGTIESRSVIPTKGRGKLIWANDGEKIIPADENPDNPTRATDTKSKMLSMEKASKNDLIDTIMHGEHFAEGGTVSDGEQAIVDAVKENTKATQEGVKQQEVVANDVKEKQKAAAKTPAPLETFKKYIDKYTGEAGSMLFSHLFHTDSKDDEGKSIPVSEQISNLFTKGAARLSNFFLGSKVDEKKGLTEFNANLKEAIPKGLAKGTLIGGGLAAASMGSISSFGLLGSLFLPGGPVGSMVLGLGVGLLSENEKFKKWLFGEKDREGNRTGGVISKNAIDFFNKNKKTIIGGSLVGIAQGLAGTTIVQGLLGAVGLGGLGVLGGITVPVFGTVAMSIAGGLAMQSKVVQERLFGKENADGEKVGGILNNKIGKEIKSAFPEMVTGGVLGGIGTMGLGLLGGMAISPMAGVIAGAAIGFGIRSNAFKDALFGKWNEEKQEFESGGLIDRTKKFINLEIFKPVQSLLELEFVKSRKWFKLSLNKIVEAFGIYKIAAKHVFDSILKRGEGVLGGLFKKIGEVFSPILDPMKNALLFFARTIKDGAVSMGSVIGDAARSVANLPVTLLTAPAGLIKNALANAGHADEIKALEHEKKENDKTDNNIEDARIFTIKERMKAEQAELEIARKNGYKLSDDELKAKTVDRLTDMALAEAERWEKEDELWQQSLEYERSLSEDMRHLIKYGLPEWDTSTFDAKAFQQFMRDGGDADGMGYEELMDKFFKRRPTMRDPNKKLSETSIGNRIDTGAFIQKSNEIGDVALGHNFDRQLLMQKNRILFENYARANDIDITDENFYDWRRMNRKFRKNKEQTAEEQRAEISITDEKDLTELEEISKALGSKNIMKADAKDRADKQKEAEAKIVENTNKWIEQMLNTTNEEYEAFFNTLSEDVQKSLIEANEAIAKDLGIDPNEIKDARDAYTKVKARVDELKGTEGKSVVADLINNPDKMHEAIKAFQKKYGAQSIAFMQQMGDTDIQATIAEKSLGVKTDENEVKANISGADADDIENRDRSGLTGENIVKERKEATFKDKLLSLLGRNNDIQIEKKEESESFFDKLKKWLMPILGAAGILGTLTQGVAFLKSIFDVISGNGDVNSERIIRDTAQQVARKFARFADKYLITKGSVGSTARDIIDKILNRKRDIGDKTKEDIVDGVEGELGEKAAEEAKKIKPTMAEPDITRAGDRELLRKKYRIAFENYAKDNNIVANEENFEKWRKMNRKLRREGTETLEEQIKNAKLSEADRAKMSELDERVGKNRVARAEALEAELTYGRTADRNLLFRKNLLLFDNYARANGIEATEDNYDYWRKMNRKLRREGAQTLAEQIEEADLSKEDKIRISEIDDMIASNKDAREGDRALKATMSNGGEQPKTVEEFRKALDKGLEAIANNKTLDKLSPGFAKELSKKLAGTLKSLDDKMIGKILMKLGDVAMAGGKLVGKGVRSAISAIPVAGWVVNSLFSVYDAYSGVVDAAELLQINPKEVTPMMRTACAAVNIIMGLTTVTIVIDLALEIIHMGSSMLMRDPINVKRILFEYAYKILAGDDAAEDLSKLQTSNRNDYEEWLKSEFSKTGLTEDKYEEWVEDAKTYEDWLRDQNENETPLLDMMRKTTIGKMMFGYNDEESGKYKPGLFSMAHTFLFGKDADENGEGGQKGLFGNMYEFLFGKEGIDAGWDEGFIPHVWGMFATGYNDEEGKYHVGLLGRMQNFLFGSNDENGNYKNGIFADMSDLLFGTDNEGWDGSKGLLGNMTEWFHGYNDKETGKYVPGFYDRMYHYVFGREADENGQGGFMGAGEKIKNWLIGGIDENGKEEHGLVWQLTGMLLGGWYEPDNGKFHPGIGNWFWERGEDVVNWFKSFLGADEETSLTDVLLYGYNDKDGKFVDGLVNQIGYFIFGKDADENGQGEQKSIFKRAQEGLRDFIFGTDESGYGYDFWMRVFFGEDKEDTSVATVTEENRSGFAELKETIGSWITSVSNAINNEIEWISNISLDNEMAFLWKALLGYDEENDKWVGAIPVGIQNFHQGFVDFVDRAGRFVNNEIQYITNVFDHMDENVSEYGLFAGEMRNIKFLLGIDEDSDLVKEALDGFNNNMRWLFGTIGDGIRSFITPIGNYLQHSGDILKNNSIGDAFFKWMKFNMGLDEERDYMGEAWEYMVGGTSTFWNTIAEGFNKFMTPVENFVTHFIGNYTQYGIGEGYIRNLKFMFGIDENSELVKDALNGFTNNMKWFFGMVSDGIRSIITPIGNYFQTSANYLTKSNTVGEGFLKWMKYSFGLDPERDYLGEAYNSVENAIVSALQTVSGKFNEFQEWWGKFDAKRSAKGLMLGIMKKLIGDNSFFNEVTSTMKGMNLIDDTDLNGLSGGSGTGVRGRYVSGGSGFSQADPRWANTNISGVGDMASRGCLPTAIANATGGALTPDEISREISPADLPTDGSGGITGNFLTHAPQKFGMNYRPVDSSDPKSLAAALMSGQHVIAGGKSKDNTDATPFTTAGHWQDFHGGYVKGGKLYVNATDPLDGKNKSYRFNDVFRDINSGGPGMAGVLSGGSGNAITDWARSHLGEQWMGGRTGDSTRQCDSFTAEAYKQAGISEIGGTSTNGTIPDTPFRSANAYHSMGDGTPQPGDLADSPKHVGLFIEDGHIISRDSSGGVTDWEQNAWSNQFGLTGYGSISEATGKKFDSTSSGSSNNKPPANFSSISTKPPGQNGVITTQLPYFAQWDDRWSGTAYDFSDGSPGNSYAASACGPTSMAMVTSWALGKEVLPTETAKFSSDHPGMHVSGGTNGHIFFDAFAKSKGFDMKETTNADDIIGALKAGKPVVTNHGEGQFTRNGHYIVYAGFDSNGKLIVYDPNDNPDNPNKNFINSPMDFSSAEASRDTAWIPEGDVGKGAANGSSSGSSSSSGGSNKPTNLMEFLGAVGSMFGDAAGSILGGKTYEGHKFSSGTNTGSSNSSSSTVDANITGDNKKDIWNFLTSNGYSKEATAGIMGNLERESSFNPHQIESGYNFDDDVIQSAFASSEGMDDYTLNRMFPIYDRQYGPNYLNKKAYYGDDGHLYPGLGLAQWTGPRGQRLLEVAKAKNKSMGDLDVQLQVLKDELDGPENATKQGLQNVSTPEEAASIFFDKFERAKDSSGGQRQANARNIFTEFASGGSGTGEESQEITVSEPTLNDISGTAIDGNKNIIPYLVKKYNMEFDELGNVIGINIPPHNLIRATDDNTVKYAKQRAQIKNYLAYGGKDVVKATPSAEQPKPEVVVATPKTDIGEAATPQPKKKRRGFAGWWDKIRGTTADILHPSRARARREEQARKLAELKKEVAEQKKEKEAQLKDLGGENPATVATKYNMEFDGFGNVKGISIPGEYMIDGSEDEATKYRKQAVQIANYSDWKNDFDKLQKKEEDANNKPTEVKTGTDIKASTTDKKPETVAATQTKATEVKSGEASKSAGDSYVERATSETNNELINAIKALDVHYEMGQIVTLLSTIAGNQSEMAKMSQNGKVVELKSVKSPGAANIERDKQRSVAAQQNMAGIANAKRGRSGNNSYQSIHARNVQIARGGEFKGA